MLTLEALETRILPAQVFWNADGGFWDVAANWLNDAGVSRLPGASDDVIIDQPGSPTVTIRNAQAVRSVTSTEALALTAGSLTVSEASRLDADVTLSGGTLFANGVITLAGATDWTAASLRGSAGIANTGSFTLSGTSTKNLGTTLANSGTIIHTGAVALTGTGFLHNQSGGVYDLRADVGLLCDFFTNEAGATLRKSEGPGIAAIGENAFANPTFVNAGGTIDVQSGTLRLANALGASTGGNLVVSLGAFLELSRNNGGLQGTTYTGTYTGSGGGTIQANNTGILQIGPAGATFNFPQGMFQWGGGIINTGAAGLTNTGFITLAGSGTKFLGGMLNNAGTIAHTGTGALQLDYDFGSGINGVGTLNNLASGVYDFQGDAIISRNFVDSSQVINAGTLRKSAGLGTSGLLTYGLPLNNDAGTIDVRSGTIGIPFLDRRPDRCQRRRTCEQQGRGDAGLPRHHEPRGL